MAIITSLCCVENRYTYQHIQGTLLLKLNLIASKLNLSHTEYHLMGILIGLYNKKQQKAFPSLKYLSNISNMSRSTVIRTIKKLIEHNLLIVVKTAGKRNTYHFSRILLSETNTTYDTSSSIIDDTSHDHEQTEIIKTNRNIKKVKNDNAFKIPSMTEYKQILEKLSGWNVVDAKRILHQHGIQKIKSVIELIETRTPQNPGAYLRQLLKVPDILIPLKGKNDSKLCEELLIDKMIKSKYWYHVPTRQTLQALPDVGKHLLIKYWKDEKMVTFIETGLTDHLDNFQIIDHSSK
jgi:DNA-binding transcriptional regulator GbsR (MarR family)